jgi:hypothetical protein
VLSPIPLCEVCGISVRSKCWVDRFRVREQKSTSQTPWALIGFVNFMKHLLLLEVKPPRWLGIAYNLSCLWWWATRKFIRVMILHRNGKDQLVEKMKVFERDLCMSMSFWVACHYLNKDIGFEWEPKLRWNRSLVSYVMNCNIFYFHWVYLDMCVYVCVCECRYFVDLLLGISKRIYKFCLS